MAGHISFLEGSHMNYNNLHELINRYDEKIDVLYGTDHYELCMWEAVKN